MSMIPTIVRDNPITTIIILVLVIYLLTKPGLITVNPELQATNWINQTFGYGYQSPPPKSKLQQLTKQLGAPSELNPKSHGSAIWISDQLPSPLIRLELKDQQILHQKPNKHTDYLYSTVKQHIPQEKLPSLKAFYPSDYTLPNNLALRYDQSSKHLTVRGDSLEANVVTHWVIKQYSDNQMTLDEAVGILGPMMEEVKTQDPLNSKVNQLLADLQTKLLNHPD